MPAAKPLTLLLLLIRLNTIFFLYFLLSIYFGLQSYSTYKYIVISEKKRSFLVLYENKLYLCNIFEKR
ncbi:Uncharacterised protein [Segatella copri]|nr:Uncharacterised protein [Segatella copri]